MIFTIDTVYFHAGAPRILTHEAAKHALASLQSARSKISWPSRGLQLLAKIMIDAPLELLFNVSRQLRAHW